MIKTSITKVTRPKLPGITARKRLFKALDSGREKPVLWVSGPAGSGKTTLVANYLDERKLPCLWYQVDAGDTDIATFFYYLGQAALKAAPRYRKPLPLLTPEYLPGISVFTQRFFEKLYARLKPPYAIVFDNYQEAPEQAALHELINIGLSRIPEEIRVFVLSRNGPPQSFTRLRANNAMHVVGWDELRFTPEEATGMVRLKAKQKLTKAAVEELHEKTGGWAAGLVLLLEGTGTTTLEPKSAGSGLQPEVFSYFVGEVFNKLDSETRDFLLMTSFLPTMTAPMAAKMTDKDDAGRILSGLNRNNFFTEKHQTSEPSYRYHALFREFLMTQMKESLNSEGIIRVQNRAAAILEEAGQVEDAAALYREAGNWERYIPLVLGHAQSLITQGRSKTVEGWLISLPRENIDGSPWALYWLGICRMPFDPRESRGILEKAFERFKAHADATGSFLTWSAIVNTFSYEWGDFSPLDRWIAVLEELLFVHPQFPSSDIEALVAAGMLNAMTYRQPRRADLPQWAERVQRIVLTGENIQLRMMLGNSLIFYYLWVGDFSKAPLVIEALRQEGELKANDPLTRQNWHVMEAMHSWFAADGTTCMQAVAAGLENAKNSGIHLLDLYLLAQGVWSGLTLGDPAAASSCLQKMSFINSPRLMDRALYQYQASAIAWYHGDRKKAAEHGKEAVKITEETGCSISHMLCLVEHAVTLFDIGLYDEAERHFARGIEQTRGMIGLGFLACLHGARFAFHRGREEEGLVLLKRGLALGADHGFMNMPRWDNGMMASLCARALEQGIELEYVRGLIRKRGLVPPDQVANWPWPLKIYTLGRFELVQDGEPIRFKGKVQQKPLALLKALIALGGKDVAVEQLTDLLWPEADGDLAHKSFEMTVQRLRRLVGNDKLIQLQERRLSLDRGLCWVDVWGLEALIERVDLLGAGRPLSDVTMEAVRLSEKAMTLYTGHFLPSDSAHAWVLSFRERLRGKFLRLVIRLGLHQERELRWDGAADVFQQGLEVDVHAEELYQHLMLCYQKLGRRAEAISVYNRCRTLLASSLGIPPSRKTEELYQSINEDSSL